MLYEDHPEKLAAEMEARVRERYYRAKEAKEFRARGQIPPSLVGITDPEKLAQAYIEIGELMPPSLMCSKSAS